MPATGRFRAARRVAALTPLVLALLAAVACGPAADPAPNGPHAPPGGRVLRIAMSKDLSNIGIQGELVKRWDADHDRVRVEIVELPEDTDRARSQLVAALQSGNPDGYDVVMLDVIWTAEFAEQHLIAPLGGEFSDDFRKDAQRTVEYRGNTWAVPWFTDAGVLYYRADLLGPRLTLHHWGDLRDAVDKAGAGDQVDALVITQLDAYEGLTVNADEATWEHHGSIVDDGRVRVNEAGAGAGLDELARGISEGPTPLFDPESLRIRERASVERFLDGKVLAMRNWPFALSWLEDDLRRRHANGADGVRYGVTTLPGPSALGGWNLAVVAGTPYQAEARKLIDYLTAPGAGRCLAEDGYVPARKSAFEGPCDADRYLQLPGGLPEKAKELAEVRQLRAAHKEALRRALETAKARPVTPYYATVTRDIQDVLGDHLRAALHGDDNLDQATARLKASLERALRGQ